MKFFFLVIFNLCIFFTRCSLEDCQAVGALSCEKLKVEYEKHLLSLK